MGKLTKFYGKPTKYTILGEEFELTPLAGKDFNLIMELGNDDGVKKLCQHYLIQIGESADDFDNLSAEFIGEFVKCITKINGLDKKPGV